MINRWIALNLADDGSRAEIAVRGFIGSWWDEVNDASISAQLESFGDVGEITVTINSRGGEVDPAVAIYNMLRAHPARVIVRIEGVAASAATIIAMAGDEIVMPANTLMMVHNPLAAAFGDARDMRAAAALLDTYRDALLQTYTARTGLADDELIALLDAETWMTASEAVELGFADRVESLASATNATALAVFATALDVPADVLAKVAAAVAPPDTDDDEGGDPASAAASGQDANEPPAEGSGEGQGARHAAIAMVREVLAAANAAGVAAHAEMWIECPDIDTARACIAEASRIKALCSEHGVAALAGSLISSRTPLATAKQLILDAKAAAQDALGEVGKRPRSSGGGAPRGPSVKSIYSNLNANVR